MCTTPCGKNRASSWTHPHWLPNVEEKPPQGFWPCQHCFYSIHLSSILLSPRSHLTHHIYLYSQSIIHTHTPRWYFWTTHITFTYMNPFSTLTSNSVSVVCLCTHTQLYIDRMRVGKKESSLLAPLIPHPYQAPPSMGFSRQEHWSGLPFPSPRKDRPKLCL